VTQSVKSNGCSVFNGASHGRLGLYGSLTGFNPRHLKGLQRGWAELPHNGSSCLYEISFLFFVLFLFSQYFYDI